MVSETGWELRFYGRWSYRDVELMLDRTNPRESLASESVASKWEPELKLGDSPDVRSEAAASTGTSGPLPGTNTWADGGHVELVSK